MTLTVTEKGYYRASGHGRSTPRRPESPPTSPPPPTGTDRHRRRPAGRLARRAVPRRRRTDQRRVLRQHGRATAPRWPAWSRFVEASPGPTGRRCSTGSPPSVASRTPSSTDRPGHHRRGPRRRRGGARLAGRDGRRRRALPPVGAAGRLRRGPPAVGLDGALVVPDVAPYQLMKLRLLNGSHSAMAYLGAAAGLPTVADVLATEWGERLVRASARRSPRPCRTRGPTRRVRRRPGRAVPQPRDAPPAAPDRLRRVAQDPRAVVGRAAGAAAAGRHPGARTGSGRLGRRHPARPHRGSSFDTTDPAAAASPAAGRHRRTRGRWSPRCCAPSAQPTSPSRPTSQVRRRPAPGAARRTDRNLTHAPCT